ncbi:MAG: peptide chain release factor N(5)-glutamine methyltransferase, partial [Acetobacteraceae bacterium]
TDRIAAAARLAAANAQALGLAGRAAFLAGCWAASLEGTFDLVLANPPYVPHAAIPDLMPEVALFEPASALDGGADGLDACRRIFSDLPRLLEPAGGIAILELGVDAAPAVTVLARAAGLAVAGLRPDLARVPRVLALRRLHEKTVWQPRPR